MVTKLTKNEKEKVSENLYYHEMECGDFVTQKFNGNIVSLNIAALNIGDIIDLA